jgi:SAM-dependent methyltransferase/ADP-ribose pyrophosphatase YjhB (NUDIX family)
MAPSVLVWLLFEADGAVLLARRGAQGRFAGQWQLPGDLVRADESAEEALRRFAHNELAVRVAGEAFAETLYLSDGGANCVTNVFKVVALSGQPRFRAGGAYAEMRWVARGQLVDTAAYPMPALLRGWLTGAALAGPGGLGAPDNRAGWDAIAAAYQAKHQLRTDTAHYGPRMPTEADLGLLGDLRGKRVLEVGCGGGQCSIAFARQGALATGIDAAANQIAYARALAVREGLEVALHEGDITLMPQVEKASQDTVFSAYALQYVEEIETCLSEVNRVLVPGGAFVFSVDHPAWQMMSEDDPYRVVRPYWDGYAEWEEALAPGVWLRAWYRSIERWFDLLRGAGFAVDRVLEPMMVAEVHDASWDETYSYERGRVIPSTLIFRAIKQ